MIDLFTEYKKVLSKKELLFIEKFLKNMKKQNISYTFEQIICIFDSVKDTLIDIRN